MRVMTYQYADSLIAGHFNLFWCFESKGRDDSKLSPQEKKNAERRAYHMKTGTGYMQIQTTKVSASDSLPLWSTKSDFCPLLNIHCHHR